MTISPSLLAFFEEAETHMDEVETALLALEKDSSNSDYVNELFRTVHSIKGNAGLVGLKEIHTISTVMETMLDKLRKEKTSVTQKDMDRLFEFLDNMHTLIEKAAQEAGLETKENGLQAKDEKKESSGPTEKRSSKEKSSDASPKPGEGKNTSQGQREDMIDANAKVQKKKMEAYLTFQLGKERYGVEINKVMEIILNRNITRVPHAKGFVSGIMNLRGMVIPVINARLKLKFASNEATAETGGVQSSENKKSSEWENIIIIESDGLRTGILVDIVDDIVRFEDDMVVSAEKALGGINTEFIQGIGKADDKTIMLLDLKTFCNSKEEYF